MHGHAADVEAIQKAALAQGPLRVMLQRVQVPTTILKHHSHQQTGEPRTAFQYRTVNVLAGFQAGAEILSPGGPALIVPAVDQFAQQSVVGNSRAGILAKARERVVEDSAPAFVIEVLPKRAQSERIAELFFQVHVRTFHVGA